MPLNHLSICLVAVGLKSGSIHLYQGRYVVDFTSVTETPSVIEFGQLGQEENVMLIVTTGIDRNFYFLGKTVKLHDLFSLTVTEV